MSKNYGRLIEYSAAFVILIIVAGVGLYYALHRLEFIPFSLSIVAELSAAAVLGFLAITYLGREIRIVSSRLLGDRRGSTVFLVYRFAAYIVFALVLLDIVGVSGTALLAGGTVAGVVLGLAGQTVLSNVISGIMIVFARPYEVNDRITFSSWQYNLIAPAYPPKFYSQDFLMPGYTGTVVDISLAYTLLKLDEGAEMKIPNSVMAQAAIVSHDLTERWVRTKYEVPATIEPQRFIRRISQIVRKDEWVAKPDSVHALVNAVTPTSYTISVDALCKGQYEEPARSSILIDIMNAVKDSRGEEEKEEERS